MSNDFKSVLARAVVTILKPILRVLIRNDVSHAEFGELARQAYVDVAYEHFSIPGRKTTYSRIAVLTGLSRKEVVRLYGLRQQNQLLGKSTPNRAARVVNGWLSDKEFQDEQQNPKSLPLQGEFGSFAALVSKYSGDITLGAVVDELERVGVVSRPDKNTVTLLTFGYVPHEDELEKIRIMSECAADLLNTAVHNLENDEQDARFQRQIIFNNVSKNLIADLKQYSSEKSSLLLQELMQMCSSSNRDHDDKQQGRRAGLGIYYFESDNKTEENENE